MGFSFAVLLSIITKKRRKPRLQQFRDTLHKKNSKSLTLYEYPAKTLFSIAVILIFAVCLEWFLLELVSQLSDPSKSAIDMVEAPLKHSTIFGVYEGIISQEMQANQLLGPQNNQRIRRVRWTINLIHLFTTISLLFLILSLKLRVVSANKRVRTITAANYTRLGSKMTIQEYQLKEGDKIEIWEVGQSRFTNTNYYYSIRIVNETYSWEIIRKSNIYSARTATIQLGFLYQLIHNTKIIKMADSQDQADQSDF